MKEQLQCPCCEKQCAKDALKCGKGRNFFQQESITEGEKPTQRHFHNGRYHQEEGATIDDDLRMLMRKCGHILWHRFGGKASQERILRLLSKKQMTTQRELLELTDVKAGSLSEILGKLESNELIVRTQNAEDKRSVDVQLTALGKQQADEHREERHQETVDMFSCLDDAEKEALFIMLEKLHRNWKSRTEGHHPHRSRRDDRVL